MSTLIDLLRTIVEKERRHQKSRVVTLGVQAIVISADNQVLLVRHSYRSGWHFPGGGVERNETMLSALSRELFEESGVVATATPKLQGIYSHFAEFPGDHIALYIVKQWSQVRVPEPNHEIREQRFYELDGLPSDISGGARASQ